MKKFLLPAVVLTALSLILLSVVYPLVLTGIGKLLPGSGEGKKVSLDDKVFYSNIAQRFTEDKYFWSRPSAVDYNAAGSGGSNKGPTNPEYLQTVRTRIDSFMAHNPDVEKKDIPVDAVTASASGLDPNISLLSARVQSKRIAQARGLTENDVLNLIEEHREPAFLHAFGPEKVNVLKVNIALDKLKNSR